MNPANPGAVPLLVKQQDRIHGLERIPVVTYLTKSWGKRVASHVSGRSPGSPVRRQSHAELSPTVREPSVTAAAVTTVSQTLRQRREQHIESAQQISMTFVEAPRVARVPGEINLVDEICCGIDD